MSELIYKINGPTVGYLDPDKWAGGSVLNVTMPSGWKQPNTRWRVTARGFFQLAETGDVFTRKLAIGTTPVTECSSFGIRPAEPRAFLDIHDILLYGDNLHLIASQHYTGIISCSQWVDDTVTKNFSAAFPSSPHLARNDAPTIENDDWSILSLQLWVNAVKLCQFRVDDLTVEKL